MLAHTSRVAAAVIVLGCTALASCGGGGGATSNPTGNATPPGAATTAPANVGASANAGASTAGAASTDPCALLTPADGQAALHKSLGAGRKVSTGDLTECVYDDAGPLVVAVLKNSFTRDAFQKMIESQNSGPFAKTTGTAVAVSGLGDAAYSFPKAGIVEVLKNATVISITSANTASSTLIARAVLPHV